MPDDLTDLVTIPDATPTIKGIVKASTTKAADNAVKSDANGGLDGWKDAISDAIQNPNAGLVKNADGTLGVDFNRMPTDKFEDLLKSLKMQIPLSANMNLYVDQNHADAADTIEDGRGTQNKPFKTIQACVNFATQTYALGRYSIYIRVANGTYSENLTLPNYTHTSGSFEIHASDYDNPPTVKNATIAGHVVSATGGTWRLYRLNLVGEFDTDENITTAVFPKTLESVGAGTLVALFGCSVSAEYTGDVPAHNVQIRTLLADDGTINISTIAGYKNSFSCTKGNATTAYMLHGLRGGDFRLIRNLAADDGIRYDIPCSGSMNTFCYLSQSSFSGAGSGNQPQFSGTITGKAYEVYNGSTVNLPTDGFPGDTSTSIVESDTYSWVKN